jgi:spore coat protein CotH
VPAPRTCFARLRLTIEGQFEDRLLGLYIMVENPDAEWAADQFNSDDVALFKPVTYELFSDLGPDWQAYEAIYDPKTSLTPGQSQRVIALANLVSHATDQEFSAKIGEFIDVDEFARFLACEVLLSNYDGPLSNGQNFLLYLDPQTDRFGFVPWDLDHSWGEFPFVGSLEQRERASIWHPWVGQNRFLERMLATAWVRERYRSELDRIRRTLFVPEQLAQQLNGLAPIVRPFIAEESPRRLARFERETADRRMDQLSATNGPNASARRPGYSLKRFFFARSQSVAQQLDGTAEGIILGRRSGR